MLCSYCNVPVPSGRETESLSPHIWERVLSLIGSNCDNVKSASRMSSWNGCSIFDLPDAYSWPALAFKLFVHISYGLPRR